MESKKWKDNNLLLKESNQYDADYSKVKQLIKQGRVNNVHAYDLRKGDRVLAFNGTNFEGIITVGEVEKVNIRKPGHTPIYQYSIRGDNPYGAKDTFTSDYVYKVDNSIDINDVASVKVPLHIRISYDGEFLANALMRVDKGFEFDPDKITFEVRQLDESQIYGK